MKMTKNEVQAILDNIHSLSKQERETAANRLQENMLALGYQNASNLNAFGAPPLLLHMEATRVLGEMEKQEANSSTGGAAETRDESQNNGTAGTTQKDGCLPTLVVMFPVAFLLCAVAAPERYAHRDLAGRIGFGLAAPLGSLILSLFVTGIVSVLSKRSKEQIVAIFRMAWLCLTILFQVAFMLNGNASR